MTSKSKVIGIFGGTGALGSALSKKWSKTGHQIIIGSRNADKAISVAEEINAEIGNNNVTGSDLMETAKNCGIAVLAVPYFSHSETLNQIKPFLSGKILVDTTVPLSKPVTKVNLPKQGSAALEAQMLLGEEVLVVSALQNIGSHLVGSQEKIDAEVLVCGNSNDAVDEVITLIGDLGLQCWHAGSIENSAAAEALTSVLISINQKHKLKSSGIKITSR
ncbi:MAG: NADPH-dependent F420 reductase [Gammaproteobacteria bacterium]|nr:NADPH-dependent F420 reductase [Gammaproteobacteria bacterium]OUT95949.1 MAG: NADPH-dependent F420 reductase [Gammaproteobacteria bacterium TMED36]|tara:strand:- start:2655 stop:3311 length:657 start_codon:yes stop_codon:yes gene_type:complete